MHFNLNFFTLLTKGGRQKWLLPIIILSAVSVAVIFMSVLRFGFKKKRTSSYKIQRRKLKSTTTLTVTITVKFFRFIFICLEMKVTFFTFKTPFILAIEVYFCGPRLHSKACFLVNVLSYSNYWCPCDPFYSWNLLNLFQDDTIEIALNKKVSMEWWLLRLTVKMLTTLRLTINIFPLRLSLGHNKTL